MKIKLGQITKSSPTLKEDDIRSKDGYLNLRYLTSIDKIKGTSINLQRPMFWYRDFNSICPAIILTSNPLQKNKELKPWEDNINLSLGKVSYYGDNKTPGRHPSEKIKGMPLTGNNKMISLINLYQSEDEKIRSQAPPILIFQNCKVGGKTSGYRKFIGLGLLRNIKEVNQTTSEDKPFVNFKYTIDLVPLEKDEFNWNWITYRRTSTSDLSKINKSAPKEWKKWIKSGIMNSTSLDFKEIQNKLNSDVDSLLDKGQVKKPKGNKTPGSFSASITQYERDPKVKAWVLQNSNGVCECCLTKSPFETKKKHYYLEVHHVKQLAKGGSDTITNTVALCPNCHKEVHYGIGNRQLIIKLYKQILRLIKE